MRPVTIPVYASGGDPQPVVPLDVYQVGPVMVQIADIDGTVDIDVTYTLDDIFAAGYDPDTGNWFATGAGTTAVAAATAERLTDANGNLINPTALRCTNAAAGTAQMRVTQSGVMG